MEFVIFSKQGMGLILDSKDDLDAIFLCKEVFVGAELLVPGFEYTLDGFYDTPVLYTGILRNKESKFICFYLGKDKGLRYYDVFVYISETKIFKKYTEQSGRDFNFKNGVWK